MKRIILISLSLLTVLVLFIFIYFNNTKAKQNEKTIKNQYFISTTDPKWKQLTLSQKLDLLRIPQDILDNMSTEEIAYAVFEFPFLSNITLYNNINTGLDSLKTESDAYCELLTRSDAKETLLEIAQEYTNPSKYTNEQFEYLAEHYLDLSKNREAYLTHRISYYLPYILFYEEQFKSTLTNKDIDIINTLLGHEIYKLDLNTNSVTIVYNCN